MAVILELLTSPTHPSVSSTFHSPGILHTNMPNKWIFGIVGETLALYHTISRKNAVSRQSTRSFLEERLSPHCSCYRERGAQPTASRAYFVLEFCMCHSGRCGRVCIGMHGARGVTDSPQTMRMKETCSEARNMLGAAPLEAGS